MSDSSRVQLAFIKEVTWGTTPASALRALRYTKESIGRRIENVRSDEVRADRMVSDIVRVGSSGQGNIEGEFSFDSYKELLEACLGNVFGAVQTVTATNIQAVASGQHFTAPSGLPVFAVGQFVRVAGFTNPANNGFFEVLTSTTTDLAIRNGAASLINEGAGASITVDASTVVNGSTKMSFTIEKFFSDLTLYWAFKGVRVNSIELRIASRQKVTVTIDLMGIGTIITTTTAGSGAYTAATTTSVMNASNNVGRVLENNAQLSAGAFIKQCTLRFQNNLRPQDAVGNIDPIGIGYGRFTITGEMQVYFANELFFNRYLNGTDSAINLLLSTPSPENDAYAITLPAVEYSNGDVVGQGNDDDVLCNMEFEAKMHPTQGIMCRIDAFT